MKFWEWNLRGSFQELTLEESPFYQPAQPILFETLLLQNGKLLFLKEHFERMSQGVRYFVGKDLFSDSLFDVFRQWAESLSEEAGVRWSYNVVQNRYRLELREPSGWKKEGWVVGEFSELPSPYMCGVPEFLKCHQFYGASAWMIQKSRERGLDEGIFHQNGFFYEGARSNLFLVKRETLITPSKKILHGITRGIIIKLAEKEGLEVECRDICQEEILEADGCFMTNSLIGIQWVKEWKGMKKWEEENPLITRLRGVYEEETRRSD